MANQVFATFRVTFNDVVTVSSLSDFLQSRAQAVPEHRWMGVACVEDTDDEPGRTGLHAHGIVFNRDARVVRDGLRRWLRRLGDVGGNELYSVSAARSNTAALRYACKSACIDLGGAGPPTVVGAIWLSGFTADDVTEQCLAYAEFQEQLGAGLNGAVIAGGQAGGQAAGPGSVGRSAVARLCADVRAANVTTIEDIGRIALRSIVVDGRPANMFFLSSVVWTVYMTVNEAAGLDEGLNELLRRLGRQ